MKLKGDIEAVFFCAGARNQLLLENFTHYSLFMEIDERIASFKALGLSKSKNKPVIICTTSGTAVSECLSAMVEAYYSETSLILVTADRPLKLQGSGAPQTIDHEVLTRGHRKDYRDVSLEEFQNLDLSLLQYPAHINVRVTQADEKKISSLKDYPSFKSFMSEVKRPLFLFSHDKCSMRSLVEKFRKYNIPFYAEVGSGAKDLSSIKSEKKLLSLFEQNAFDGVVRIGHTPLSKVWRLLEGQHLPVYSFDSRNLKGLSYGTVEPVSSSALEHFSGFWYLLPTKEATIKDESMERLHTLCESFPQSEIAFFKKIHDSLPTGANVFLGNSLCIRYFELVQTKPFNIMVNRGVNGIDGQLATAQGWSLSVDRPVYCILGDMTFSYDLSSLINFPENLKCIVINNAGGRIFEVLKMDQRLVMEHEQSFKDITKGFNLRYQTDLENLHDAQIIELKPDNQQSKAFLEGWRS